MATILDERQPDDKLHENEESEGCTMPKELDTLSHEEIIQNLDNQIALLKYQLERLEYLRFGLSDAHTFQRLGLAMTHTWDETVAKYLSNQAAQQVPPAPSDMPAPAGRTMTNYEKVVAVFRRNNNAWTTSDDIAKQSLVKQSVLRDILYKTHKDQFERQDNPEGRGKLFRLVQGG